MAERESQIVLGLDPDPAALWPGSDDGLVQGSPAERAGGAVLAHCRALIDATAQACVAVKLQLACFERLGAPRAQSPRGGGGPRAGRGLLVIADGKRGDIEVSATAYAQALFGGLETPFGKVQGLGADLRDGQPADGAGRDRAVRRRPRGRPGRACWCSCARPTRARRTSRMRRSRAAARCGSGWPRSWTGLGATGVGEAGLSDVGAVVGATVPGHLARARELMGSATFLLPGVGAQGGRVEDLAPAFAPGRAGGLVTASRSIADAHLTTDGEPAAAARAEAERLREAAWTLSERAGTPLGQS